MVSSTVGGLTMTVWNLRSSAASFSMYLRYSSRVVAPMQWSSPRASMGLSRLPASMEPSEAPAPTTVWSSSMKRMILPSALTTSLRTAFSRSSNSPRYLAPAIRAPMSRATSLRFFSPSGTSPRTIRRASPSAMAVLPTPGSPMRTGLFLVRRERIWMTRRISSSLPMTGSSLSCMASWVRSFEYFLRASKVPSGSGEVTRWLPRMVWSACSTFSQVMPALLRIFSAEEPEPLRIPMSRCSTLMYSSFISSAFSVARVRTSENSPEE